MSLTLARINPRHIPQGVICHGFIYVKFSKLYLNGKERMTIFASPTIWRRTTNAKIMKVDKLNDRFQITICRLVCVPYQIYE